MIAMILAMIPARMGSQRLRRKNLRELAGLPLIVRAIRKCKEVEQFDEIWVNSEHDHFSEFTDREGVCFHKRPEALGDNQATSEHYIYEFLKDHQCDYLVQVHTVAPLLRVDEIKRFVQRLVDVKPDAMFAVDEIQIECVFRGRPVNFSLAEKINSQDLEPVQRISWAISAWRRHSFIEAFGSGRCATYSGNIAFFPISRFAGHIIKTEQDLQIAEALLPLVDCNAEE